MIVEITSKLPNTSRANADGISVAEHIEIEDMLKKSEFPHRILTDREIQKLAEA